jgi:Outer membrane protein beta-barrel family
MPSCKLWKLPYSLQLLFVIVPFCIKAQQAEKRKITGNLQTTERNWKGIVNLSLYRKSNDSVILKTVLTDSTGKFEFTNLPPEIYILAIDTAFNKKKFIAEADVRSTDASLTTIFVEKPYGLVLSEVRVTGKKPFMEVNLDRITYNIAANMLFRSNSAYDILKKLPGLQFQPSATTNSLADIQVLIDGKGNRSGGEELQQMLRSLRSENIEKIEVYTNPPARFDAQGGIVVNIILKKQKAYSSISSGYSQKIYPDNQTNGFSLNGVNSNANLRYSFGKFKATGFFSILDSREGFSRENVTSDLPGLIRTNSNEMRSRSNIVSLNTSFHYTPDKSSEVSLYIGTGFAPSLSSRHSNTYKSSNKDGSFDSSFNTYLQRSADYNNPEVSVSYHKKTSATSDNNFFSITGTKGSYRSNSEFRFAELSIQNPPALIQQQQYSVKIHAAKMDYGTVFGKKIFTAGIKFTSSENTDMFKTNTSAENLFTFRENIYAGYINLRGEINKITFQAGIRAEQTDSKGVSPLLINSKITRKYLDVFPSLQLSKTLKKTWQLSLAAGRRIVRPNYGDFNPYNYTVFYDPLTTQQGLASIRPQYINQATASISKKDLLFQLRFNNKQNIRSLTGGSGNNDSISLRAVNVNSNDWSLLVNHTYRPNTNWTIINTLNCFYYATTLLNGLQRNIAAWSYSVNNSIKIAKKINAEIFARYGSPFINGYAKIGRAFLINTGFSRSFLKDDDLELSINIDDILGTNRIKWIYGYETITTTNQPSTNERSVRITAIYYFKTGNRFKARAKQTNDFGEVRYTN